MHIQHIHLRDKAKKSLLLQHLFAMTQRCSGSRGKPGGCSSGNKERQLLGKVWGGAGVSIRDGVPSPSTTRKEIEKTKNLKLGICREQAKWTLSIPSVANTVMSIFRGYPFHEAAAKLLTWLGCQQTRDIS